MPSHRLVLYYSRTGTSRVLAERLVQEMAADLAPIVCNGYARGPFGFVQALTNSLRGRLPALGPHPDLARYQALVLVSPIWTDTISTPMRAFLAGQPTLPARLGIAVTSIGTGSHPRALRQFRGALPRGADAELAVTRTALTSGQATARIHGFVHALENAGS